MGIINDKRDGHDFGKPFFNTAAYVYVTFVSIYTIILLSGIYLLWHYRSTAAVRIRGFTITTAAVLSLHVYVAALFIVYPLNGCFKCGTEFWIMSTLLPLGIAIFQLSNVRFLHYSNLQGNLIRSPRWIHRTAPFSVYPRDFITWFKSLDYVKKTFVCISVGLLIQVVTTLFLYFGSKRFMPSTGFFGQFTDPAQCRRGYEWIPSVLWQLAWSWIFGPMVYFKTRHVRDVHYWGWQTRLSILAGLPGTPLWLTFLYGTNNRTVSALDPWFLPALWFAPGLIMMQLTSIFVPLYDLRMTRAVNNSAKRASSVALTPWSLSTISSWKQSHSSDTKKEWMTLSAMEFQLSHDVKSLMEFAGTREFSAENIIFLNEIRKFKLIWTENTQGHNETTRSEFQGLQRKMFRRALNIFAELIEPKTAKQPVNLEYCILSKLRHTFLGSHLENGTQYEQTRNQDCKSTSLVEIAPWIALSPMTSTPPTPVLVDRTAYEISRDTSVFATEHHSAAVTVSNLNPQSSSTLHTVHNWHGVCDSTITLVHDAIGGFHEQFTAIPNSFTIAVFDDAERSVKHLVYTNTWGKFIEHADAESIACSRTSESDEYDRSESRGIDGQNDKASGSDPLHQGSRCKTCAEWQRQLEPKQPNRNRKP